ncbi:DNA polymerase III subunit epsilon [Piscinibacter koreensis]|uniref:DNA polymerase III subunit epsilon n=1 Tax=Piscinibacter koreensis TaxID=2742824 RepID=A0A7Y6NL32_9BURK|nr:DNA polymerase III subunit epsilon [Schlegelella koreensis]NUZ05115.1 DNA polymerase III subunit epsilon [Schlegelella koreensis]
MRQIFLDTETTGLSPESGDRIIEIGCVELVNRRLTGNNLHLYVNPQRRNTEDALKIHGLTDEFLATKPVFRAIVDELLDYVRGAEIIIHNAAFDVGFLNEELKRIGRPLFTDVVAQVTDSLLLARDMFPGKSNSLDALCKRFEVNNANRTLHGALLDAGLLAEVYIRMTRGQEALVIDTEEGVDGELAVPLIDLRSFEIVVIEADADEALAHAAWLADLDKASGGRTVWPRMAA